MRILDRKQLLITAAALVIGLAPATFAQSGAGAVASGGISPLGANGSTIAGGGSVATGPGSAIAAGGASFGGTATANLGNAPSNGPQSAQIPDDALMTGPFLTPPPIPPAQNSYQ